MGIDIYLEWSGKPDIQPLEHEDVEGIWEAWREVNNAPGVYIRESYFAKAYATHVFVPETFDTAPFTGRKMPNPYGDEEGVEVRRDEEGYVSGVHYPWKVLAGRMEAVAEQCQARYPGAPETAREHLETFMAFVVKTRELQEAGHDTWVANSY